MNSVKVVNCEVSKRITPHFIYNISNCLMHSTVNDGGTSECGEKFNKIHNHSTSHLVRNKPILLSSLSPFVEHYVIQFLLCILGTVRPFLRNN